MDVLLPEMNGPGERGGIDDGVLGDGGDGLVCCVTTGRACGILSALRLRLASPAWILCTDGGAGGWKRLTPRSPST